MSHVLAIALQSMHHDSLRLDAVSANLANASTPGYKREVVSVRSLDYASLATPFAEQLNVFSDQMRLGEAAAVKVAVDGRPGTLKSTGQNLDMAIEGPGFFEVSTEFGPAYTRQGNFSLDATGRLVTAQGQPVIGTGGEITLNASNPTIDARGYVYEGIQSGANARAVASKGGGSEQRPVAQLKLVQFDPSQAMARLGNGLLSPEGVAPLAQDSSAQVRQGFLENSNVSSMQEMVQLMQTMRHFESMQKVALGYDEMMGTAIRKLGDLS